MATVGRGVGGWVGLQPWDSIHAARPPQSPCFPPRGEVTWDCMKTQLGEAVLWTWLRLQDITVAVLDWALAAISQQ